MSHEITDKDKMISARNQTPWHGLGEIAPSFEVSDLYRILNWTVKKVPLVTINGDKTEGFATTFATTVATTIVNSLVPLLNKNTPTLPSNRNNGCAFCGIDTHFIQNCSIAQQYIRENKCKLDGNRFVLADESEIPS